MLWMFLAAPAFAGDFMDVWVTTAFEDDNVLAGPEAYSPAANFVSRGNQTFFENYDSRFTDDISQSYLVLYRKDDGFNPHIWTEAALVLRFAPYLNPDKTEPGTAITDDGSYVRLVYKFGERKDHNVSLTGYAIDANRFRLGYSYDLTWGGRTIFITDPIAAPGARLQYQNGTFYAFAGLKTAIGDYVDPTTGETRNQSYYGGLAGLGGELGEHLRLEGGVGDFQQGQLLSEATVTSTLYGSMITAAGASAQLSVRTNKDLDYIVSNELKLYRNAPEFVKDTYISHRRLDGTGLLVQAEGNLLVHNLLDPDATDATTVEKAFAGDAQALLVHKSTEIGVDFVYKDLPFIVFNVPGVTSGYALPDATETTPQIYGRAKVSQFIEKAHVTPSIGVGIMQPATYKPSNSANYYVVRDDKHIDAVPDGQNPAALLSSVVGVQWDVSKSVVGVGELLYTLNNNISDFVQTEDEVGTYVLAPATWRNQVGFNLMVRARF